MRGQSAATDHVATLIQRAQLERISTGDWELNGEQLMPGPPARYRLIPCGTGRTMKTLTAEMVADLLHEGWIERDGTEDERRWGYRVTQAGILATKWPWRW